ncbi:YdeI/OmpD-associated family protein [Marilutibacter maris]|nr:YdeI/OmpD-associated family protein [Lysobacter maris]
MDTPTDAIRFQARLLRPASPRSATWSFFVLPKEASAPLPSRGMTTVEGRLGGHAFKATLEPDGSGSHWLKVTRAMREAAGVGVGDTVAVEVWPAQEQLEAKVPPDLRKALAADPAAKAAWSRITLIARRDWVQWITTAKKAETREKRIANACSMLATGKREVCCFDRSGIYSKAFSAPEAAE